MPLDPPGPSPAPRIVIRGACPHDCPDTCALLVTVENGRAIKVEGAPDHPTTNGVLCTKVARYLERTYSGQRVLYPLRRVGRKGEGKFERISWEAALSTIVTRFKEIAASADGRRLSFLTVMRAPWACFSTAPWTGAFFTSSALHCSIGAFV